jgi:hypothetical protein
MRAWSILLVLSLFVFPVGCTGSGDNGADGEVDADADGWPGTDCCVDGTPGEDGDPGGDPGADEELDGDQGEPSDDNGDRGADEAGDKGPEDEGEPCENGECVEGAKCCNDYCSNLAYDPLNCGDCEERCPPETPFCSGAKCGTYDCAAVCVPEETCCGSECCAEGQVCCIVNRGGPVRPPSCYWGHCPAGCPTCK